MPRYSSDRSDSPKRGQESPRRRSPSRRERSPARQRSSRRSRSPISTITSQKTRSPDREKRSSRARSPKHVEATTALSRSPSPRTKRLRRVQAEREVEKVADKEYEKNGSRDKERGKHREKGSEREVLREKGEKRSARDGVGGESSRSRRERSASPTDRRHRDRYDSRSPPKAAKSGARDEVTDSRGSEQHLDDDSVAMMKAAEEALEAKQKQKPSFELSGKLAAETNRVRGVTLLFTEPPDARKPEIRWRLYVFKAGEVLNEPLYIHRQSCYLFGRERRVADIPTDHPSCSKQHAVIQFRQVEKEQPDGMLRKQVRPFLMDLGSTNGTFINDDRIESQRYYELIEKDTIKFGNSSREYVILHENSAQ
ncbi:hypothetical protein L1049_025232 [Liquidambar formosana]|uniref:FHA domain-containing protein n=1 Tax=Liquidambar formosana TaxID=63359 RepID=A0AAP0WZ02_LIQFO